MSENQEVGEVVSNICAYLATLESSSNKDLDRLLLVGRDAYAAAAKAQVKGAEQMRLFYCQLTSLNNASSLVDFKTLPESEIRWMPREVQTAARIANKFEEMRASGEITLRTREPFLDDILTDLKSCLAPEAILLRMLTEKQLEMIRQIHRNSVDYRACVQVELAPSLRWDSVDERETPLGQIVSLPIVICNYGPGDAAVVDIRATIDGENCTFEGTIDSREFTLQIRGLEADRVVPRRIPFRYTGNCQLKIEAKYSDLVILDAEALVRFDQPLRFSTSKSLSSPRFSRNPYVLTSPISSDDWDLLIKERTNQMDVLTGTLTEQGSFVAVRGLRRTGKTTLLWHFMKNAEAKRYLAVYVDCLVWQMEWHKAEENGRPWTPALLLGRLRSEIDRAAARHPALPSNALAELETEIGVEEFQEYVRRMCGLMGTPLILIFDEADSLETFPEFAALMSMCFKSLVRENQLIAIFAHEWTTKFWDGIWEKLGPVDVRTPLLSQQATWELAQKPLGIKYTPLALEYLWRITGGYPSLVQLVCHHLVRDTDLHTARGTRIVQADDVRQTVRQILSSKDDSPHLDHFRQAFILEDDRQYVDYLQFGFSEEERRMLSTQVKHDQVDLDTSVLTTLSVRRDAGSYLITEELRLRFMEDWPDFSPLDNNDVSRIDTILKAAAKRLLTKEVICFHDPKQPSKLLRLRVGMLALYLKS